MGTGSGLGVVARRVVKCRRCPDLRAYCREVARVKRAAYRDWSYWGKPVPGFGDPEAELVVIGLAPAAHGANRTGRMFTGDRSGAFLHAALHRAGFSSQPTSTGRDDGLMMRSCYITAILRCAPPGNKPSLEHLRNCRSHLRDELACLPRTRVALTLGKIAFDEFLKLLLEEGVIKSRAPFRFAHGAVYELPGRFRPSGRLASRAGETAGGDRSRPSAGALRWLAASYHPSQQNTQTGKLTPAMLDDVLSRIVRLLASP